MLRFLLLSLFLIPCFFVSAQKKKDYTPSDISTVSPAPYDFRANRKFKKEKYDSFYLTMRDGNRIAVELYLPKGLKEGERIPTIMHQTRYWRSFQLKFPFSWFVKKNMPEPLYSFMKELVKQGYAVVNVDARGSGASFGNRKYPWSEDEVKDGAEIADWIIKQKWSDGNIGAAGASYSGTTSEFLLTNKHPNVKAVVNLFSLFDVYEDNAFPGGIHNRWFTSVWGDANYKLDNNIIPTTNKKVKAAIKGVSPVKGKDGKKLLKEAIASHSNNLNVNDGAKTISFRDDVAKVGGVASDHFSPHRFMKDEDASGAAVYSYSGWTDGAYQHAAIKRFLNLSNPHNKLLLGPWEHGGRFNTSPANPGESGFDHLGEILKFFDFHLKGKQNGIDKEPRVHYFTMGEEKWKSAETWPPPKTQYTPLYLNENKTLSPRKDLRIKNDDDSFDSFRADTTVGSGPHSRWRSLAGKLQTPHIYPDRKSRDSLLTIYETSPLNNNFEVSGHAIANLFISSSEPDACLFVYLEDVDEKGNVHYVTEGLFRAIHRKVSDEKPPYKDVVPYHSYLSKDTQPLVPEEITELRFDILPVSYLFKKGHKIRIAIAGADADHFRPMTNSVPEIKIWRNERYDSRIELPAAER